MKKALIIAAGSVNIVPEYYEYEFIISADGGYNKALDKGIVPDLFVGDMDSVNGEVLGIEIVKLKKEKDFTDTEYAIEEAVKRGYKKIDIIGATGTRIDHTIANVFMMKKYLDKGVFLKIIDDHNIVWAINKRELLSGLEGRTVSLIPADTVVCGVTLIGFKYHLKDAEIKIGETLTVSNVVESKEAIIDIEKGTLIVVVAND